MNRKELLDELRHVVDDTAGPPYAWTDARLLRWMADGEDLFCAQTGFFTDASTFTITTTEGERRYALPSDRIIEVKEIWNGGHKLRQYTQNDRVHRLAGSASLLAPQAWQMDEQTGIITLLENPLGGIVLTLRVHRRSMLRLDKAETPSIPEQCHLGLVEYAAAKAFGDHDRERQDPVKATDHMANFRSYVNDGIRLFDRLNNASPQVKPNPQYLW